MLSAQDQRRFVLFSEEPSQPVQNVGKILQTYRQSPLGTDLKDLAKTSEDRELIEDLITLMEGLFNIPELADMCNHLETILRHSYIKRIDMRPTEAHYLSIIDTFRNSLLIKPEDVHMAITSLHELSDELMADRGTIDRARLRSQLQGMGIPLRDSINFRDDFRRLFDWSNDQIITSNATGQAALRFPEGTAQITRRVVEVMPQVLNGGSFLVVGEAGIGKTGCLLGLAENLITSGIRVWYCAANSSHQSIQQIHNEIGLQHSWEAIFAETAAANPPVLIVDSLDGLRDAEASRAYRDIMALAIQRGLRVIASIRSFDLLHSPELKRLFKNKDNKPLSDTYYDETFKHTRHIAVLGLEDSELAYVESISPTVKTVFDVSRRLKDICRNLFYLKLLSELLEDQELVAGLTQVGSRAELFDRWWEFRIESHFLAQECISTLRAVLERMVNQRVLRVSYNSWQTEVKRYLFSSGILRNPPAVPGRLADENRVEFCHHYLFDHAAMKLFVKPRCSDLPNELSVRNNWGLFLRPSLTIFFRHMWAKGREEFWEFLSELERSSIMFFHKIPAYLVVASEAAIVDDLDPLLVANRWPDQSRLIQDIVTTARYHCLNELFRHGRGEWWLDFSLKLIGTNESHMVHAAGIILHCAAEEVRMLPDSLRLLLNQGSVKLIRYYWRNSEIDNRVKAPLKWICQTITIAPESSKQLLRSILSREEIQRTGYIHMPTLSNQIAEIWRYDPALAVEIYAAVFSYREIDESTTPINQSHILPLVSTRKQDYQSARYSLRESFTAFLQACPVDATRALIRVIRGSHEQNVEMAQDFQIETFDWAGSECRINDDASGFRFSEPSPNDDEGQILIKWEEYLSEFPDSPLAEENWKTVREVLISENGSASIWRSLLKAAHQKPEFYAGKVATILLVGRILFGPGTKIMARNCLRNFPQYLSQEFLSSIQKMVLKTTDYRSIGRHPLDEHYLNELKVMILSAFPPAFRDNETSQFLSACDPQTVSFAEKRINESDEIAFEYTWDDEDEEELSDWQADQHALNSIKYLAGLAPQNITAGNLPEILTHIQIVEECIAGKDNNPKFRLVPASHWLLSAFAAIACSNLAVDSLPIGRLLDRFQSVLSSKCAEPGESELIRFDGSPGWDDPDPLVKAALGFLCLEVTDVIAEEESLRFLHIIANHPFPRVRYQLTKLSPSLLGKRPDFVMETFELWVREARETPGRFALIVSMINQGILWSLRNLDLPRTERVIGEFCATIHERGSVDLRHGCGKLVARYHIQISESWAGARIGAAVNDFHNYYHELYGFAACSSEYIFQPFTEVVRLDESLERATILISHCLRTAHEALSKYVPQTRTESDKDEGAPPEWARQAINIFELVALELGRCVHKSLKNLENSGEDPDPEKIQAWWERVEPILKHLLLEPYPKVVDSLIRTFKDILSLSPVKIFKWLTEITRAGIPYGIAYEESTADHTLAILEQLFADQRIDFRSEDTIGDVIEIVENYLRAGWPRAFEFSTQLEQIFR